MCAPPANVDYTAFITSPVYIPCVFVSAAACVWYECPSTVGHFFVCVWAYAWSLSPFRQWHESKAWLSLKGIEPVERSAAKFSDSWTPAGCLVVCLVAVVVNVCMWRGVLFIGMPLIPLQLTPGGQCAWRCFSLRAEAPSDGVKDDPQQPAATGTLHLLAPLRFPNFLTSQPHGLPASRAVFIPLWVFYQSPHSISIPVTAPLATYQAAPIARQAAFWVVSISFQCPDSYQSQRPWTRDDFQPRAKCLCVTVS